MTNWKEELARAAGELAEEMGDQPATSADDRAVDEQLSSLLAAAGEDAALSDATADALDELFAGQEPSPELRRRLRATMARAQEERESRKISVPADWSLGRYLRTKREALGVAIGVLANDLGLQQEMLEGLEAGKTPPDHVGVRPLLGLAEAVRAPLMEFLEVVRRTMLGTVAISATAEVPGLAKAETRRRRRERLDPVTAAQGALSLARHAQASKFLHALETEVRRRGQQVILEPSSHITQVVSEQRSRIMNSSRMGYEDFEGFFQAATGLEPYDWQVRLARGGLPEVLSVPTGLGKTAGVVLSWAWQRSHRPAGEVPRHLVYCLPMRVLVRQTRDAIVRWLAKVDLLSGQLTETGDGISYGARFDQEGRIGVAVLYGGELGEIEERWAEHPEGQWILVGTQDQLLSRALNRGYAMSPYQWPVHFGLLNNDCHWVLDEVQLMGPGLWTSAQLDWMRRLRFGAFGPCGTTWMSATLGTGFLATVDRRREGLEAPRSCERLDAAERRELVTAWLGRKKSTAGQLTAAEHAGRRLAAMRPVELFEPSKKGVAPEAQLARAILDAHLPGSLSLVVCNTVEAAQKLYKALGSEAPCLLLTSRFRADDRLSAEGRLLSFEARRANQAMDPPRVPDDPGLICISTQIVEAGLDVSARRLWSEVAPCPSIVQRLGRCNRDGREVDAIATFWIPDPSGRRDRDMVGPYERAKVELGLALVKDLAQHSNMPTAEALDDIYERPDARKTLEPDLTPLPRAKDVHELFSTERDVHGGYTDVGQFVRGLDVDQDALVFWRRWDGKRSPNANLDGPAFDPSEACPVATFVVRAFLNRRVGWIWEAQRARWEKIRADAVRPGMVVMLPASYGGYSEDLGWTGRAVDLLGELPTPGPGAGDLVEEPRTENGTWVPLDVHLADAEREARELARRLGLDQPYDDAVACAAALHDLGKPHPRWQGALPEPRPLGLWAKSPFVLRIEGTHRAVAKARTQIPPSVVIVVRELPDGASSADRTAIEVLLRRRLTRDELDKLRSIAGLNRVWHPPFRPGLRHEAAAALALWWRYWSGSKAWPLLSIYLAAAHHGKVRTVLRSLKSGDDVFGVPCDSSPMVVGDQGWPLDFRCAADGTDGRWEGNRFFPTSPGWTALVADLLGSSHGGGLRPAGVVPEGEPAALGPFRLAYLEALVRVADWRASDRPSAFTEGGL